MVAPDQGAGHPCPATAAGIIARLSARGQSVATAESLTGGLLAAALTDIPGASAAFRGGVVAYATELKAVLLGVDPGLLDRHGAVSAEVAGAMAGGVAARLGATFGVSTTGVAGPDRAEGKPAGTVFIAASAGRQPRVRRLALAGGRNDIRRETVAAALALLLVIMREENR
jgi:nicotinamide-nucleotide amidase